MNTSRYAAAALLVFGGVLLLAFAMSSIGGSDIRPEADVAPQLPDLQEVCKAPQPTIVIFSAEWCGWCKKLEETLKDPEVQRRLEPYAIVHVDIDQNRELARKAGVRGVPMSFALARDCKTVDMLDGYASPADFIRWLDRIESRR